MRTLFSTIFLVAFSTILFSQKHFNITGIVTDSTDNALPAATVVLLQKTDSVMVSFGITSNEGLFEMKRVPFGDYLLQVTYVGYNNLYAPVSGSTETGDVDMGFVKLQPVSSNLDEVIVSAEHIPMMIKNDTVEYNADAFKTQPGSVVEDLLKKLPGVEVDRAGNIKAQGENINKVLVDGKEFFGDDPKIATKNLPADAVDKVQVFDKKSDMAEFSGIDDGNEQKTINLELKEGKKKGYFGNIEGGYGTDDRYQSKFNLNKFNKKSQISLIGMANNINEQGFSLNDYINFMGGLGNMMGAGGGGGTFSLNLMDSGLPLSMGMQDGIMRTWAGGLNFNRDFGEKTELNMSYFYNQVENNLDRSIFQQALGGDNGYTAEKTDNQLTENTNHRLNFNLTHEIDSFQNIILRGNVGLNDASFKSSGDSRTFNSNGILQNTGLNDYFSNGDNFNLNSSLIYRRKFKKKGRFFSADISLRMRDNISDANLESINGFLDLNQVDTIMQRQKQDEDTKQYGAKVSYTEPIGKASKKKGSKYLEFNYAHQNYDNALKKDFFDILDPDTRSEVFNNLLSRQFQQDYIYDRGGMNFKWNKKKMNFNAGISWQQSQLKADLILQNQDIDRTFRNWLPNLRFRKDFEGNTELNFNYDTGIREPSLEQLQPIVDNSNPLSIYSGNPELKPEYNHNFSLHFMNFNQFSFTNVFANIRATYTRDKITNATSIDEQFRQHITPINVDSDFRVDSYLSFGTPLKFIKSRINMNLNLGYNKSILFVNNLENNVDRWNNSFDITIDNRKKEIIDIAIGAQFGYNVTKYDVSSAFNENYLDQTYFGDLIVNLGKTTALGTSFDYTIYSEESFGDSQSIPLWKANITQFLFKKKGRLKLSVFDLLNKNIGVRRNSNLNFISDERVNALGRYFMLTFGWSIAGFGNQQGGIQIEMDTRRR